MSGGRGVSPTTASAIPPRPPPTSCPDPADGPHSPELHRVAERAAGALGKGRGWGSTPWVPGGADPGEADPSLIPVRWNRERQQSPAFLAAGETETGAPSRT